MYYVGYDNGSGYIEAATGHHPTPLQAFEAADIPRLGDIDWEGQGYAVYEAGQSEPVDWSPNPNDRLCTCGSGEPWVSCSAGGQYCG